MTLPLAGIKIVEVAMWAYVPSAGGMLSDMGAEVIKIEPHTGDPSRGLSTGGLGPGTQGIAVQWQIYNRGKKSVAIDLAAPGAAEVLYKIIAGADVFLTSLLPPARRKMKIDVEDIRSRFPDIIYAVGSGQGAFGPDAEKGGYDYISFWSRGGVSAAVTPPTEPYPLPMPSGAFGDCTSGAMLVAGIAAAIAKRERTGEASVVDGSLLASSMWSMQSKISSVTAAGLDDLPKPGRTKTFNPLVNAYRTGDGRFVVLSMLQEQRYWPGFCAALGRPDMAEDPRFCTAEARHANIEACVAAIDEAFAGYTLGEAMERLHSQEGQWDVVQLPGHVHRDAQVVANRLMQEVELEGGRKLKVVSAPVQFDRQPLTPRAAPELGADSDAVLAGLGYSEDDIIDLKVAGIVL